MRIRFPILLEGPDGAGKTTLAAALQRRFRLPVVKNYAPPGDLAAGELANAYYHQLEIPGGIILDRAWPSEAIYSKAMGRECKISPEEIATLWSDFDALCGAAIFCLPPLQAARANWLGRPGELFQDAETFGAMYRAYSDVLYMASTALPLCRAQYHFDYTEQGATEEVARWLEALAS